MGIFSKGNNKKQNKNKNEKEESEKLFKDGSRLMKLKQYEAAIKEFKSALKLDPEKFDFLYNTGLCFFNLEDYREAIDYFDKSIRLKEDNENKSSAYYYKGSCFLKKNKNEKTILKALDCFSESLEINPKDVDCLYMKGCMETELDGVKEATESFDKVLELNPKFENYYESELFDTLKEEKGPVKEESKELKVEKRVKEYKTKVGLKVNKMTELIISNFLFDNDIKFQYKPLMTWSKENFEPLFFLPKFDLYLEHFEEEDESMKKKVEFYNNYNKSLICTTPKDEEDLLNVLKVKLKNYVSDIMKKRSLMGK